MLKELKLVATHGDLSRDEKLVLVMAMVLANGDPSWKFDANFWNIAIFSGLTVPETAKALKDLENRGIIQWSGGTRASGTRVMYTDMFMPDRRS